MTELKHLCKGESRIAVAKINSAEKDATSGLNDDDNGYLDDWIGYDFVDDVSVLEAPCVQKEDCSVSDNAPRDFNVNGTHCAGLVAAITNNNCKKFTIVYAFLRPVSKGGFCGEQSDSHSSHHKWRHILGNFHKFKGRF